MGDPPGFAELDAMIADCSRMVDQLPSRAEYNRLWRVYTKARKALITVANIGSGEAKRIALETLRSIDAALAQGGEG